ncbi:hypothetical protein ACQ4M4_23020 [Leptolyngbya sp. AN02str]|uniref:hypothetical protein n=1 Tax=Leptolyngbya sp. AN02str TaxID=3423363 RepID=UPI003D3216D9
MITLRKKRLWQLSRLTLLRLLRYSKPYRRQVGGAIASSILNTLCDLASPD